MLASIDGVFQLKIVTPYKEICDVNEKQGFISKYGIFLGVDKIYDNMI
jgi:hypothetical protein